MKLFFASLLLVFALAANAVQPIAEQFINGSGVIFTNTATIYTNGNSSVVGLKVYDNVRYGGLYNGWPSTLFYSQTSSNIMPTVVSNALSGWSPGTLYWTNLSTFSVTNPAAGGIVTNANIIQPTAFVDIPTWVSWGQDAGALSATIQGDSTAATNKMTFVFRPVFNAPFPDSGTIEAHDILTLVMFANGTNYVTTKTNLPDSFISGALKLHLDTITTSTNAGGGKTIVYFITGSGKAGSMVP